MTLREWIWSDEIKVGDEIRGHKSSVTGIVYMSSVEWTVVQIDGSNVLTMDRDGSNGCYSKSLCLMFLVERVAKVKARYEASKERRP